MATSRLTPTQKVTSSVVDYARPTAANTEFSGTSRGVTAAELAGNINAMPNPLGDVEQPSYHFKFYIEPDLQAATGGSSVIIAETGRTGFNIKSVKIDAVVSPNFLTRNQTAQKFTITIAEPLGCALPDKMFLAAKSLGVRNFIKCPYRLSLDFLGYNPESGAPERPIDKVWVWSLMVTKLETTLTETGSVHTIEAINYNELGNQNQFNLIPVPIQIDVNEGQGTIREVMQGLEKQLNANIAKRHNVASGGRAPYRIVIEDRPYPASYGAKVGSPFDHKIVRDTKYKDSSRNQGKLQVSRGTDIGHIVDYLMSASETAVEIANPSQDVENTNGEQKPHSVTHMVDVEVTLDDYDDRTQEYVRTFKFVVRPHANVRVVVSSSMEDGAEANAQAKLAFAQSELLLRKQYDYLFTGTNTEVLDLDINLNFLFNVANNLYQGHVFQENASPGREFDEQTFPRQSENKNWVNEAGGNGMSFGGGSFFGPAMPGARVAEDLTFEPIVLPMSFTQDGKDPRYQVQPSIESNNLRGRSIYGMILNQLYGSMDGNLMNINMLIRGDPYWLGVTNMESNDVKSSDTTPNFINGEHMFLLKFFLPQGFNEDGSPILNLTDLYSGFYAVMRVEHNFTDGQFTQNLNGVRIPAMNVSKLLSGG